MIDSTIQNKGWAWTSDIVEIRDEHWASNVVLVFRRGVALGFRLVFVVS